MNGVKDKMADFGTSRYCKKCGGEIVAEGEVITMYEGKKICKCRQGHDSVTDDNSK